MTLLVASMITRLLVVTALAVPPARAYCYYDAFNNYECNSDLNYTARVLIGLGVLALCLAIIGGIFMRRRSLVRSRNLAYLQTQQQPGQYPPPPPGGWANPVPGAPSQYPAYPPKSEYPAGPPGGFPSGFPGGFSTTPQEPPRTYNPGQPAYPPVPTSPPGYFTAPSGPPPTVNNETRPNQPPAPYSV